VLQPLDRGFWREFSRAHGFQYFANVGFVH
jgi:hypothetical protein